SVGVGLQFFQVLVRERRFSLTIVSNQVLTLLLAINDDVLAKHNCFHNPMDTSSVRASHSWNCGTGCTSVAGVTFPNHSHLELFLKRARLASLRSFEGRFGGQDGLE